VWTPPGSENIGSAQGRYFIPMAPVALLLLNNSRLSGFAMRHKIDRLYYGVLYGTHFVALFFILKRYYVE
jgi:uncharacterized membrane protein